jgi:hypothetical protein
VDAALKAEKLAVQLEVYDGERSPGRSDGWLRRQGEIIGIEV